MPNPQEGARRVLRAKAAGRGARAPREIPLVFYTSLTIVSVLGVVAIGYSRYEVTHPPVAAAVGSPPRVGQTWYTAVGIEVCGHFAPVLPRGAGAGSGMTALGNGVVKVAPQNAGETGVQANLARFLAAAGVRVSGAGVTVSPGASLRVAQLCPSRSVRVRYASWTSLLATTPRESTQAASVRLLNGEVVTVAVLGPGERPQQPPTAANLANVGG